MTTKEDLKVGGYSLQELSDHFTKNAYGYNRNSPYKFYRRVGSKDIWRVLEVVTRFDIDSDEETFLQIAYNVFCLNYKLPSGSVLDVEDRDPTVKAGWSSFFNNYFRDHQTMYFLEIIDGSYKAACNKLTFDKEFTIIYGWKPELAK